MRVSRTSRGFRALAHTVVLLLGVQALLPVLFVAAGPMAQGSWMEICTAYGIRYVEFPIASVDADDPPDETPSEHGGLPFTCPLWMAAQPALLLDPPGRAERVAFTAAAAFLPPPAEALRHAAGDYGPPLGARAPPIV